MFLHDVYITSWHWISSRRRVSFFKRQTAARLNDRERRHNGTHRTVQHNGTHLLNQKRCRVVYCLAFAPWLLIPWAIDSRARPSFKGTTREHSIATPATRLCVINLLWGDVKPPQYNGRVTRTHQVYFMMSGAQRSQMKRMVETITGRACCGWPVATASFDGLDNK